MVGYVVEGGRGRRSFVALLAAVAVAVVGFYLMSLSTAAKPAEAATSCKNVAKAPYRYLGNDGYYVMFTSRITCTADIGGATLQTNGYKNGSFLGGYATKYLSDSTDHDVYEVTTFKKCSSTRYKNDFKTSQTKVTITAKNGTKTTLPNRFTGNVGLYCS